MGKVPAPVGLGQGYDSITGAGMFTAIATDDWETVDGESVVRYHVCESLDKVMSSLEINESLSVDILGGLFSVNQKLEFMREQSLTTHSVSIVVYAKKTTGRQMLRSVKLPDDVAAPQTADDFANFLLSYGDSFVVSRTLGGEYMAIYTYFSETQEEKRNLTASMEAAGVFKPVSLGASLQTAINNFNSSQKISYTCRHRVTGIQNPPPLNEANIIEYAATYLSSELTANVIINQDVYGYEHVPGIGTSFNQIRLNVQAVIDFSSWGTWSQGQNDIRSILKVYDAYGARYTNDEKLEQVHTKLGDLEKAFRKANSVFRDNPPQPLDTQEIEGDVKWLREQGVPQIQFETKSVRIGKMNMWSANPVDDIGENIRAFLQKNKRVTTLQMTRSGSSPQRTVTSLNVTYMDAKGKTEVAIHGWATEDASQDMKVPNPASISDIITGVFRFSGSDNWYLGKLGIELSDGESLQFGEAVPDQWTEVKSIHYPTPADHFVLGFRSLPTEECLLLEVVYASLSPCVWKPDGTTAT